VTCTVTGPSTGMLLERTNRVAPARTTASSHVIGRALTHARGGAGTGRSTSGAAVATPTSLRGRDTPKRATAPTPEAPGFPRAPALDAHLPKGRQALHGGAGGADHTSDQTKPSATLTDLHTTREAPR